MNTPGGGGAEAFVPGIVNWLVSRPRIVAAMPYLPIIGGVDPLETRVRELVNPLGLDVRFIDDWENYHALTGEVHCGTNAKRGLPICTWW